jgi:hypothetical protein
MFRKILVVTIALSLATGAFSPASAASKKTYSAKQADQYLKKAISKTKSFIDTNAFLLEKEILTSKGLVSKYDIKVDKEGNYLKYEEKSKKVTEEGVVGNTYYIKGDVSKFTEYEVAIAKELGIDLNTVGLKVSLTKDEGNYKKEMEITTRNNGKNQVPNISIAEIEKKYPKSTYSYTKNSNTETLIARKVSKSKSTLIFTMKKGVLIRFVEFDKNLKPLQRFSLREFGAGVRVDESKYQDYSKITTHPLYKNERDLIVAKVYMENIYKDAFEISKIGLLDKGLSEADLIAALDGLEGAKAYGTKLELVIDSQVDGKPFTACGYYPENLQKNAIVVELKSCSL